MVKWPIAKILILYRPEDLKDGYDNSINLQNGTKYWDVRNTRNKAEILLRYQHTPALISSRTMLVYSQPRTREYFQLLQKLPKIKWGFFRWHVLRPRFLALKVILFKNTVNSFYLVTFD